MQDYTTPLQQLLTLLAVAVSTGKQLTYEQVFFFIISLVFVLSVCIGPGPGMLVSQLHRL